MKVSVVTYKDDTDVDFAIEAETPAEKALVRCLSTLEPQFIPVDDPEEVGFTFRFSKEESL